MVQEVAVDGHFRAIDLQRGDAKPVGIDVLSELAPVTLAKEDDVGHNGGPFSLEGVRRQADRAHEIRLVGEVFADGRILLVEGEVRGDERQHAAGLQGVDGLGEEVVVEGVFLSLVVELQVGERHVADDRVDAPLGQLRVAEVLDADVLAGVDRFRNPPRDGIHFYPDEACPRPAPAHEVAGATAGFEVRGPLGHAQALGGVVDGGDDGRRGVEGVEV